MEGIFRISEECEGGPDSRINYEGTGRTIDKYHVDLPYPEMTGIAPNKAYANIISGLYAGQTSEITAVMQYFYASCQLKKQYADAYTAFKYISVIEMEHMDILANVIIALGGDPEYTYRTNMGEKWWTAKNVRYSKTARQILIEAIIAEENAISGYMEACRCIKDEAVTAIIHRIIMDERLHLEIFRELYKKLN